MAGEIVKVFPGCDECARLREAWVAAKTRDVLYSLIIEVTTHQKLAHDWPPDEPLRVDPSMPQWPPPKPSHYHRRIPDGT
jgi:hypothetical protein